MGSNPGAGSTLTRDPQSPVFRTFSWGVAGFLNKVESGWGDILSL